MAFEWIHRPNNFLPTSFNHSIKHHMIEKLASTSKNILSAPMRQNISNAVQKSGNSNFSPWSDSGTWITIFLYAIIFFLAVIGNVLVILTLIQSRRMRTITNLFLLNLAVSDLLLAAFCMPFTLIGKILRDFIFGEIMCRLLPYLQGD